VTRSRRIVTICFNCVSPNCLPYLLTNTGVLPDKYCHYNTTVFDTESRTSLDQLCFLPWSRLPVDNYRVGGLGGRHQYWKVEREQYIADGHTRVAIVTLVVRAITHWTETVRTAFFSILVQYTRRLHDAGPLRHQLRPLLISRALQPEQYPDITTHGPLNALKLTPRSGTNEMWYVNLRA